MSKFPKYKSRVFALGSLSEAFCQSSWASSGAGFRQYSMNTYMNWQNRLSWGRAEAGLGKSSEPGARRQIAGLL